MNITFLRTSLGIVTSTATSAGTLSTPHWDRGDTSLSARGRTPISRARLSTDSWEVIYPPSIGSGGAGITIVIISTPTA